MKEIEAVKNRIEKMERNLMAWQGQKMKPDIEKKLVKSVPLSFMLEMDTNQKVSSNKDSRQVNNAKLFSPSSEQAPTLAQRPVLNVLGSEPTSMVINTTHCQLSVSSQTIILQNTSQTLWGYLIPRMREQPTGRPQ